MKWCCKQFIWLPVQIRTEPDEEVRHICNNLKDKTFLSEAAYLLLRVMLPSNCHLQKKEGESTSSRGLPVGLACLELPFLLPGQATCLAARGWYCAPVWQAWERCWQGKWKTWATRPQSQGHLTLRCFSRGLFLCFIRDKLKELQASPAKITA